MPANRAMAEHISLFTRYTAEHIMLVPEKESGGKFMFEITNKVGLAFHDMLAYDELMDMIMFLNPNDPQQFTKYVHEITNYKIKAPL
jgi:hypothetical protein